MTSKVLADKYSLQAFMNSFLRDYGNESFVQMNSSRVDIEFPDGSKIRLLFSKQSLLGQHQYQEKAQFFFNGQIREIAFEALVQILTLKLFGQERAGKLQAQILQSRDVMQAMHEHNARTDLTGSADYRWSEQSLLLGHPFHPYPKARTGMDMAAIKAFSPEFKPVCKLIWWIVKAELLATSADHAWLAELFNFDFNSSKLTPGYLPLPVHAWQATKLKQHPTIAEHIKSGDIKELGIGKNDWYPTSSLRSLYCEAAPYLLKFSISAKLTNSFRHLKLKEVMRGVQVTKILKAQEMLNFFAHYPQFSILHEANFTGILSKSGGSIIDESIVVCRDNLDGKADLKNTFLLASLVEVDPFTGKSRLNAMLEENMLRESIGHELAVKKWFASFLQNAVEPFFVLASEHGVLLGAHLQNVLVECKQGYPIRVIFKDCQGTGFSRLGRYWAQEDNGNILDAEQVEKIFIYYLVINNVFGVINAIADCEHKLETWLINEFRNLIYKLNRRGYRDNSFFNFLLTSKFLYQKGNFRCSVYDYNETTMTNPVDIYNVIGNPLTQFSRSIKTYDQALVYERYIPSLKNTVSFRIFDIDLDLPKFYEWNHKKYVSDFWELDKSYAELAAYITELKQSPYQLPLIYEVGGVAIGYFELYWAYDDRIAPYCQPELYDRGLHLLIGEEKYLRSRYVLEGILNACRFMFEDEPRTKNVWGEPRSDNKSILKIADAMPGWRFVREFDFPHKRAALIQCARDNFYQDLEQWKQ